jgi:hypothetical protein
MSQPDEDEDEVMELPVPPADFSFLVESILVQIQVQLGLLYFGNEDERPAPNLNVARHSIDMLAMLQEKTKGNLAMDEIRLLENGLTEMRFRYVQVSSDLKQGGQKGRAPTVTAPADASTSPEAATGKPEEQPRIILADGGKGSKSV